MELADEIHNIYGKFLVAFHQHGDDLLHERMVLSRTDANLSKAYLAIRCYQIINGRLPADLSSLIEAGILDALPIDLFTGDAIIYDRTAAEIRSAGPAEPLLKHAHPLRYNLAQP